MQQQKLNAEAMSVPLNDKIRRAFSSFSVAGRPMVLTNCSVPVRLILFVCPHLRSIAACDEHARFHLGTNCSKQDRVRHVPIYGTPCASPGNRPPASHTERCRCLCGVTMRSILAQYATELYVYGARKFRTAHTKARHCTRSRAASI